MESPGRSPKSQGTLLLNQGNSSQEASSPKRNSDKETLTVGAPSLWTAILSLKMTGNPVGEVPAQMREEEKGEHR